MPDPVVRDHRKGSGGPGYVYQPGDDGNIAQLGGNSFRVYGQTFIWNSDGTYSVNGHRLAATDVNNYIAQAKATYEQTHNPATASGTPNGPATPDIGGVRGDAKDGFSENKNPGSTTGPNGDGPATTADTSAAFKVPGFDELNKKYNDQYNKILGQTAYQTGKTILGPVANSANVNIGPAAQATAVQVGKMAQADNSAIRADQLAALAYQNDLMHGKNSVAGMIGQQQQQQLISQQQAAALSGRPGQQAMLARVAAQNEGSIGTNMAYQTQVAQQAERNAAANAYGTLAGQARGQDQDISMFNAGQTNQGSLLQAQLSNAANLQNSSEQNRMGIAQGNLTQQNNQFNAGSQNDFTKSQADMNQRVALANTASQNTNAWNQVQSSNNNLNSQVALATGQQAGSIEQQKLQAEANMQTQRLQNALDQIAAQKPELWQRLMSIGATSIPAIIQIMKRGDSSSSQLSDLLKGTALDFGTGGDSGGGSPWAGALGGAAAGASAGAMFGPWGAAIGGVGGALLSFL